MFRRPAVPSPDINLTIHANRENKFAARALLPKSGPNAQIALQQVSRDGAHADPSLSKGGVRMSLKKLAIYAAALVVAAIASHLAQAGGRSAPNLGVSASSPGHQVPPSTGPAEPGKSQFAPGDIKNDKDLKDAKSLAPGSSNPNKK